MFRHYITSIDYVKLIELQANTVLDRNASQKFKSIKPQSKSKVIVKKMNRNKEV